MGFGGEGLEGGWGLRVRLFGLLLLLCKVVWYDGMSRGGLGLRMWGVNACFGGYAEEQDMNGERCVMAKMVNFTVTGLGRCAFISPYFEEFLRR